MSSSSTSSLPAPQTSSIQRRTRALFSSDVIPILHRRAAGPVHPLLLPGLVWRRYGANLLHEAQDIRFVPVLDQLAVLYPVDEDTGHRDRLAGGRDPEQLPLVGTPERPAGDH